MKLSGPNRSSLKSVPPEQVNSNCFLSDIQARDLNVTVDFLLLSHSISNLSATPVSSTFKTHPEFYLSNHPATTATHPTLSILMSPFCLPASTFFLFRLFLNTAVRAAPPKQIVKNLRVTSHLIQRKCQCPLYKLSVP